MSSQGSRHGASQENPSNINFIRRHSTPFYRRIRQALTKTKTRYSRTQLSVPSSAGIAASITTSMGWQSFHGDGQQASSSKAWQEPLTQFKAQVGAASYQKIMVINSIYTLRQYLDQQTANYTANASKSPLPANVVDLLQSVGAVAGAIAPTTPEIGALIWGSVGVFAEKGNHWLSGEVFTRLPDICKDFDRFERLLTLFPECSALKREIEDFYQEVVLFLGFSIHHLQRSTASSPPRQHIKASLSNHLLRVKGCVKSVEREANIAGHQNLSQKLPATANPDVQGEPSLLEPLFDIPPNQKFTGREVILNAMQSQLTDDSGQPLRCAAVLLYGLGGMGKSSIAIKYIYDNYTKYEPYIFWIASDTRQKLHSAVLEACQRLNLPLQNSDSDLAKAPRTWRQWLEHSDHECLVVFDNVEEGSVLSDVWPRTGSTTIIMTSRRRDVGSQLVLHEHEVAALSPSDSRILLLNFLSPPLRSQGLQDIVMADKICGFLDGLPLAITLTASMICGCQSLSSVLEKLERGRKILLEWCDTGSYATTPSLMVLWEANINDLPDSSLQLLYVMSFLDPDNFVDEMVTHEIASSSSLSLPSSEGEYLIALARLSDCSLIRRERSSLCMHRLLQDVIIERMRPETLRLVFDAAVQIVHAVFPKQPDEGLLMSSLWLQCQKYRSHVESLETRYRQQYSRLASRPIHLAELTYGCSWLSLSLSTVPTNPGMYVRAIELATTGLNIVTGLDSETRLLQADLWTTIGAAQLLAAGCQEAYDSLKRAFDLRMGAVKSGLIDSGHAQVANSYMNLGTAAIGAGNVQEAIDLGEKSIELRAGREEGQLQMLAMSHHNVALASLFAGQLDKAERFSKASTKLSQINSPSMTTEQRLAMDTRNVYGLANIYLAQGKVHEGRLEHEKALELRLEVFTETHPYTACSYWKLGRLWQTDDWQKAVEYYEKSVGIYDDLLPEHAPMGRSLHHLGWLLREHNDPKGVQYIKRAAKIYSSLTGKDLNQDDEEPFKKLIHVFYS
ncbi:hypothetical protein NLG97_g2459 [Lecanicillium saksenae]|uniref:Uncharacterized protein n=1 Tax=Lecanicillium saksenae TaxID=468837 RepID=A0ACC1R0V9_9HYPO|nr:hypothetical protein NLG97_g2459 [Lecanicillium saksenae]